jgi:hypothetical protein
MKVRLPVKPVTTLLGLLGLHDRIIGALEPTWWMRSGSFLEHRWKIGTDDPTKRRHSTWLVCFDVIVAPGLWLTDPALEYDLITAKLLAYWSLSPECGHFRSATGVPLFVRNYVQFVRWRMARGIPHNASLTREWIEELFITIRDRGIRGLLPLEERATAFARAIRAGEAKAPTFRKSKHVHFDFNAAAIAMGVPNGRLLTDEARAEIIGFARELGYALRPYQKRSPGFSRLQDDFEGGPDDDPDVDLEGEFGVGPEGDSDKWNSDGEKAKGAGVQSLSRIAGFLKPLAFLYKVRGRLDHDPIGCNPFAGGRTPETIAKAISNGCDGRTMTVPPFQACALIDQALTWVLDYAPEIKAYVKGIETLMHTSAIQEHWSPYRAAAERMNQDFAIKAAAAGEGV